MSNPWTGRSGGWPLWLLLGLAVGLAVFLTAHGVGWGPDAGGVGSSEPSPEVRADARSSSIPWTAPVRRSVRALAEGPSVDEDAARPGDSPAPRSSAPPLRIAVLNAEDRTAVPGARVVVRLRERGFGEGATVTETRRTDRDGLVSIPVAPLELREHVSAFVSARAGTHLVGESHVADLRQVEGSVHEVLVHAGITVYGVVSERGSSLPVAGARVRLSTLDGDEGVSTDELGEYRLTYFPAAGVGAALEVTAAGYGRESVQLIAHGDGRCRVLFPEPVTDGWSYAPIAVDVQLPRSLAIVGRVVDPEGEPVELARVRANGYYSMAGGAGFPDQREDVTGASGAFELSGLRSDIGHELRVRGAGLATKTLEIPSSPGGFVDCGDVRMLRESVVGGVVLDGDGRPAGGLRVRLEPADAPEEDGAPGADGSTDPEPGRDAGFRLALRSSGLTDADGRFAVGELAPGAFTLSVRGLGREIASRPVEVLPGQDPGPQWIRLPPLDGPLEGVVVHEEALPRPLWVVLSRHERRRAVPVDRSGRFRFAPLTADSGYELRVFVPGPDGALKAGSRAYALTTGAGEFVELSLD